MHRSPVAELNGEVEHTALWAVKTRHFYFFDNSDKY